VVPDVKLPVDMVSQLYDPDFEESDDDIQSF